MLQLSGFRGSGGGSLFAVCLGTIYDPGGATYASYILIPVPKKLCKSSEEGEDKSKPEYLEFIVSTLTWIISLE